MPTMYLPSRRHGLRKSRAASKKNNHFLTFALLTFVVGAINIHLHNRVHDEHVEDKFLRQFQERFKTSREEGATSKKVLVQSSSKNDQITAKSAQPQEAAVGERMKETSTTTIDKVLSQNLSKYGIDNGVAKSIRFKASREEGATSDKVLVQSSSKNNLSVAKSAQQQAAAAGERKETSTGTTDKVLPQNSSKNGHIIDHSAAKPAQPQTSPGNTTNITATTSPFVRHDHVVIATKIHGEHQVSLLMQSMCLLHYAYNHKVLYDIIAFSTEPIPQESVKSLQAMVAPAKFSLVVDNKGLQEEYAALPSSKKVAFLKMCNVTTPGNLTWFSNCEHRLAYNWQAEFRGLRIWNHASLANYKTMLWLDTDGFATKPWEKDPVDYFVKNNGAIMFDHFPMGSTKYYVQKSISAGFNASLCKLKLSNTTGNLVPELGGNGECQGRGVPNIHGFFHITDMDFYRSKPVQDGLEAMFAEGFLRRSPCDQAAVTVPAAMLAPERSWEMRAKGFRLDVFHNFMLDGIDQAKPAGFLKYWKERGQYTLPSAAGVCNITEGS